MPPIPPPHQQPTPFCQKCFSIYRSVGSVARSVALFADHQRRTGNQPRTGLVWEANSSEGLNKLTPGIIGMLATTPEAQLALGG